MLHQNRLYRNSCLLPMNMCAVLAGKHLDTQVLAKVIASTEFVLLPQTNKRNNILPLSIFWDEIQDYVFTVVIIKLCLLIKGWVKYIKVWEKCCDRKEWLDTLRCQWYSVTNHSLNSIHNLIVLCVYGLAVSHEAKSFTNFFQSKKMCSQCMDKFYNRFHIQNSISFPPLLICKSDFTHSDSFLIITAVHKCITY